MEDCDRSSTLITHQLDLVFNLHNSNGTNSKSGCGGWGFFGFPTRYEVLVEITVCVKVGFLMRCRCAR